MAEGPLNVWDYERLAEEKLEPGPFAYFAAGAGDEWTLRENIAAFARWTLRPRILRDVGAVTTTTSVLGTEISVPILVAPMAYQRHAHPEGELATSKGAAEAGTIMCLSTMATATPADVASAAPAGARWFQLYVFRDAGVTRALVEQAVEAGYSAIVLTADTPLFGRRERDLRTNWKIPADPPVPALVAAIGAASETSVADHFRLVSPSVGWRDVEQLAATSRLPVVVKGVHTAEDAVLAVEHGAAAVIASNHGGRQLDGVPAAIDMLPEIAEAVDGRIEVLMDGGIRRGTDVIKALALGARSTLAGRAVLWGLAVDGAAGVARVLELLRAEVALALALCGCADPAEVTRAHVARVAP